jgi:hypothetical protein
LVAARGRCDWLSKRGDKVSILQGEILSRPALENDGLQDHLAMAPSDVTVHFSTQFIKSPCGDHRTTKSAPPHDVGPSKESRHTNVLPVRRNHHQQSVVYDVGQASGRRTNQVSVGSCTADRPPEWSSASI